ncbi:unnamed protein product [Cochlearia groenlandica]
MAYINNVLAVLFIAVAIAVSPCLAEPTPTFPTMNPVCATAMPDLLEKCFATVRETPTQDCCNDLKSATTTQVKCLCDNYIANPDYASYTRPYAAGITSQCGVFDKYSCDGTTKEKGSSSNNNNSNGKENNSTNKDNGGISNNVASSLFAVFGLLASVMF